MRGDTPLSSGCHRVSPCHQPQSCSGGLKWTLQAQTGAFVACFRLACRACALSRGYPPRCIWRGPVGGDTRRQPWPSGPKSKGANLQVLDAKSGKKWWEFGLSLAVRPAFTLVCEECAAEGCSAYLWAGVASLGLAYLLALSLSAETSDVAGRSPSMPEDPILRAVLLMAVAVAVALIAAGEAAAWLRGR
jgi:hypothetical protein